MTSFKINLIRADVPAAAVRRHIFLGVLAYLAACGAVLVVMSHRATLKLMKTQRMRAEIRALEGQFHQTHAGQDDIVMYGRNVNHQLEQYAGKLETINRICDSRTDLGRLILALSTPLPMDVNLSELVMSRGKKTLEFEVNFPVGSVNETIDATQLIAAWNGNAAVTSQVSRIGSLRSQKKTVNGKLMENWHFTCLLLKGGE